MFRKLSSKEHEEMRELCGSLRQHEARTGIRKLMQNYQDTAVELAEHDAAMDARLGAGMVREP